MWVQKCLLKKCLKIGCKFNNYDGEEGVGLSGEDSRKNDEEKNILEVKYVFTNPLKHVKLKSDDLVFVLA